MRRIFISLLAIFSLISCGHKKPVAETSQQPANTVIVDSVAIVNDPANNLNVQTNHFVEIDSSGVLLFPLSMGESGRGSIASLYKSMPVGSYWNIVFLNSKTNESHLLGDQKMLIRDYNFDYGGSSSVDILHNSRFIFYTVTTTDFNQDKKLTDEDPSYLFVTDKTGHNFRQISPSRYHLEGWKWIKSANKIFMTVRKDSDQDKKFDEKDEVATFEMDMDKDAAAKEVFSADFKNKLKILFDRDWKRVGE